MDNKELAATLLTAIGAQLPLKNEEKAFPDMMANAVREYYFAILKMLDKQGEKDARFTSHH